MILNRLEYALMNNPLRAALQRQVEGRILNGMGGATLNGRVLEIGCGRGVGVDVILDVFGATFVDAFDLDHRMVERARVRHAGVAHVRLWHGDATRIAAADNSYDAVFDFGILHHIPDWSEALREVYRVIKPGGRLYAEEPMKGLITNPVSRLLFDHPQEDRFGHADFVCALAEVGFEGIESRTFLRHFAWFLSGKPVTETGPNQ